jgi:hypothetical protein
VTHHQLGPPLTLTERLEQLNDNLQSMGERLKEAIAGAIGTTVAEAVRDAVHGLLTKPEAEPNFQNQRWQDDRRQDRRWAEDTDPWSQPDWRDPEDPWQDRSDDPHQYRGSHPTQAGNNRLGKAMTAALQTTLLWLQEQKCCRPVLATGAVALTAGLAAFFYGPSLAAGVGVLASMASLLLTSRGAALTAGRLAEATAG